MWNVKSNTNFIPSFLQNTNVLMIIRWQWRNIVIASITFQQVLKAVQTVTQAKWTNKTFLYYVLMDFWRALKFEIQVHFVYELSTRVVLHACKKDHAKVRPSQSPIPKWIMASVSLSDSQYLFDFSNWNLYIFIIEWTNLFIYVCCLFIPPALSSTQHQLFLSKYYFTIMVIKLIKMTWRKVE